jgi:hypothetical protein
LAGIWRLVLPQNAALTVREEAIIGHSERRATQVGSAKMQKTVSLYRPGSGTTPRVPVL